MVAINRHSLNVGAPKVGTNRTAAQEATEQADSEIKNVRPAHTSPLDLNVYLPRLSKEQLNALLWKDAIRDDLLD